MKAKGSYTGEEPKLKFVFTNPAVAAEDGKPIALDALTATKCPRVYANIKKT